MPPTTLPLITARLPYVICSGVEYGAGEPSMVMSVRFVLTDFACSMALRMTALAYSQLWMPQLPSLSMKVRFVYALMKASSLAFHSSWAFLLICRDGAVRSSV